MWLHYKVRSLARRIMSPKWHSVIIVCSLSFSLPLSRLSLRSSFFPLFYSRSVSPLARQHLAFRRRRAKRRDQKKRERYMYGMKNCAGSTRQKAHNRKCVLLKLKSQLRLDENTSEWHLSRIFPLDTRWLNSYCQQKYQTLQVRYRNLKETPLSIHKFV